MQVAELGKLNNSRIYLKVLAVLIYLVMFTRREETFKFIHHTWKSRLLILELNNQRLAKKPTRKSNCS